MKYAINLFPHSTHPTVERLKYFGTHHLRVVLIITQLVVICVFMYRFTIDQKIIDEKQKLSQKLAIIEATKSLRTDLEEKQKKIKNINTIFATQDVWNEQVDYIRSTFPQKANLKLLSIDGKTVTLTGTTDARLIVQQFYQRLSKDKRYKSVNLGQFTRDGAGLYEFEIVLEGYQAKVASKS